MWNVERTQNCAFENRDIVSPKATYPVEWVNQDNENMLSCYLEINNTNDNNNNTKTKWWERIKFIEFMKNTACHSGVHCKPYEALFGSKAKIGL